MVIIIKFFYNLKILKIHKRNKIQLVYFYNVLYKYFIIHYE